MVRAPAPGAVPSVNQDPLAATAQGLHAAKNEIDTKHKVINFGVTLKADSPEEEKLYSYKHQRAEQKVSKGTIPVGFLCMVETQDGPPVYLETKDGGFNELGKPIGPMFQVSWKSDREVVGAQPGTDGWMTSLDDLWKEVLAYFERKRLLSEDSLIELDVDPFVLFGIDDIITQQALVKLATFPALKCEGATPEFDEWALYLRIDPEDTSMDWLVKALSETDLPKPWTCYKGVGSIVCYIKSDTGQVTWKHPFYDYFRQLRDFCEQATPEEVMKVRVNRLLWSYEATRVETEHDQEPLISPEYIQKLSDVFGYDVREHGYLVRNLKAQLKVFARSYRVKQDVDLDDVNHCAELLHRDLKKYGEMKDHWQDKATESMQFELTKLANGDLDCVNCGNIALSFCLECKDYLCLSCYDILHSKGARMQHSPFRLVPCTLCKNLPAKLHCTFTDKSLCHKCYAMRHIKMLPPDGKENQPRRIDYVQQYAIYSKKAQKRAEAELERRRGEAGGPPGAETGQDGVPSLAIVPIQQDSYESVLSTDWHPFYDSRGVKYYFNFTTSERMRQSPRRVPTVNDPEAEEVFTEVVGADGTLRTPTVRPSRDARGGGESNMFAASLGSKNDTLSSVTQKMELSSRDPMSTSPDLRSLRAPHRKHMPHEVPAM